MSNAGKSNSAAIAAPDSVLIIQTAFIGDVILGTALIEALAETFPTAKIDFLVRSGNESLLQGHPLLREVLVFDKRDKFRNMFRLIGAIRSRRYDLVINVQRFATTGIITALAGAKMTIGFDKNPMSLLFTRKVPHEMKGQHEVDRNGLLISFLVGDKRRMPRLYPAPGDQAAIVPYRSGPYMTISPASVWTTKQFPPEKWIEFLLLLEAGAKVFLLGSGQDRALCETIATGATGRNVVVLAGTLSLLESAALMAGATMNFVNDSAPMHLASAMNAPVTAVFCSTVPAFGFGPLSEKSTVVETQEHLSCRPCGLHGHRICPQGHFKCALTIRSEQLLRSI